MNGAKLELHVHLEGTVRRPLLERIGRRNGALSDLGGAAVVDRIYAPSTDLAGFLRRFKPLTEFFRHPDDFHDAALSYGADLHRQGVIYAEIHLSAPVYLRRGLSLLSILAAIDVAFVEARRRHGIELRLILDGVRQWGPESMRELIRQAEGTRRYGVVGIGMGGDETAIPAAAFRTVFAAARRRGWPTTVHAGEAAGAAAVREAIEVLEVDRIEHGVAAATEPVLLDRLAARGIALDLCPTSHRRTGAVAADRPYPIRTFLDRGIPVTIGTDDPALFDTDLNRELRLVEQEGGLEANDMEQLQDNALQAAFLEPQARARLASRLLQERRTGVTAGIDTTPAGC